MQLTARLVQVLPAQTGQSKNGDWRKQEIIVETDGQYPKKVCVTVWGDKLNHLPLNPGDILTIDFDIESREYNGKWYNDVKAWKVADGGASVSQSSNTYSSPPPIKSASGPGSFPDAPPKGMDSFDDDLPF